MANDKLTYLQMPLPQGQGSYKILKTDWQGLDKRAEVDAVTVTVAENINTDAFPYLEPCKIATYKSAETVEIVSLHGFNDVLVSVNYREGIDVKLTYYKGSNQYAGNLFTIIDIYGTSVTVGSEHTNKHLEFSSNSQITVTLPALSSNICFTASNSGTGAIKFVAAGDDKIFTADGLVSELTLNTNKMIEVDSGSTWGISSLNISAQDFMSMPRSIVKFNVFTNPTNPLIGTYQEKLVIFPDRKSIDFNISGNFTPAYIPGIPRIKYATVHNSRLFGVDDTRIYASGFNDYTNWTLDTIGEDDGEGNLVSGYNENNAWISTSQSNTKGDGKFTGITSYAGHVICFKKDHIQEIYNNKNPFRVVDVYSEGTIDSRSVAEVDGKLIFVSDNDVKIYTGSTPQSIGGPLNISKFDSAMACGYDGKYYLCCSDDNKYYFFVYDSKNGQWVERSNLYPDDISAIASNADGPYTGSDEGDIYGLDRGDYEDWKIETSLILNGSINPKRIRKIQLLADMDADSRLYVEALNANGANVFSWTHENTAGDEQRFVPIRFKPSASAGEGIKLRISGWGYARLYHF